MWKRGTIKVGKSIFTYEMKQYDEPSIFGINEGRISKLALRRGREWVLTYDRGWDIEPQDEDTRIALEILLKSEN